VKTKTPQKEQRIQLSSALFVTFAHLPTCDLQNSYIELNARILQFVFQFLL